MLLKKIGLVTLYQNNYGSALQCYALETIINKLGYDVILLYESPTAIELSIRTLKKRLNVLIRSIIYPGYFTDFLSMRNAMKIEQSYLTTESSKMLRNFVSTKLIPKTYTWKELKKLGSDDNFKGFVVGSDQVWNVSREISPFFFLKFAPSQKRHSYAVSLGVEKVPKYFINNLKKGINGFSRVSVREYFGKQIIRKYTNIDVIQNVDPTLLLSAEEWRKFYGHKTLIKERFILVHFLNEPSDLAISKINLLSDKIGCKVVGFAYYYNKYKQIKNLVFIDGDPKKYIYLIDKAQYVLTDSYHTTIFSINLKTKFYVFHRQYLHNFPQTNRITELLKKFNLSDKLIKNQEDDLVEYDFDDEIDNIICHDKDIAMDYLIIEFSGI